MPLSNTKNPLKLSLAQWSLNRAFFSGALKARDFAKISKETYGIDAIDYVNGFYKDQGESESFWLEMKRRANDVGVTSLLIMVDDEGDLGNPADKDRQTAVTNHYKWIDAAKMLGCHSIRVNAFGTGSRQEIRQALVDGLGKLTEYGEKEEISVLIENHGLHTSDAAFIANIIQEVDNPYLGTLPDFGNWCLTAQWGSTQIPCDEAYDRYQGVQELLPYAKSVSAKTYNFNDAGEDTTTDYNKMLSIVHKSGYDGYIGIEYEGTEKPEHEGILLSKALIETVWAKL